MQRYAIAFPDGVLLPHAEIEGETRASKNELRVSDLYQSFE
jgi:hypothetical protein